MLKVTPVTAQQLMKELSKDPVYVARQAELERLRAERLERSRREQFVLLKALRDVGISVNTVWDLVNSRETYREAIPALVEALEQPYPLKVKEGVIRALTVKEARGQAGWPLLHLFSSLPQELSNFQHSDFRWVIANALTRASTPDMYEALLAAADREADDGIRKRLEKAVASVRKGATRRKTIPLKKPTDPSSEDLGG